MPAAPLPENGEVQVGSRRLPEGCRTYVDRFGSDSAVPVAWVTIAPVPDPGAVWAELSDASPSTGLVPFIARSRRDEPHRPWDDGTHRQDDYFSLRPTLPQSTRSTPPCSCAAAGLGKHGSHRRRGTRPLVSRTGQAADRAFLR